MTATDTIPGSTLYLADALAVLPTLAGPYLILTDPPYGVDLTAAGSRADRGAVPAFRGRRLIAGDDSRDVGQAVLDYCRSRRWPVCTFADALEPWAGDWRQSLVWDKGEQAGIGGDRKTCWKQTWELIQVGRFPEVFGSRDSAVLRFPIRPGHYRHHPAAKPLRLMRYLIRKLTRPTDTILDPFMGSGTTIAAAICEGRRAVGIECDPGHYATALRRCREATCQDGLFAAAGLFEGRDEGP